jgi:DEAD/DEAH box helicase domain-containing protein
MRHVILDIETQMLANDPEVGGWKNLHLCKVACAVLYQVWNKRFRIFGDTPSDLQVLRRELENADRISGFNIRGFDLPVIWETPKGLPLPTDGKVDDLQDRIIYGLGGDPITDSMRHGKYNLDLICRSTLGVGKIADGASAPAMWRSKRYADLHNYCCDDVALERDLCWWMEQHGFVRRDGDVIFVPKWEPLVPASQIKPI